MKKLLLLFPTFNKRNYSRITFIALCLFFLSATSSFAQEQIGSFCGLRLGMTLSEVRSVMVSKGKEMVRDTKNSNKYIIKKMAIAGYTFNNLILYFEDDRLVSAGFYRFIQSDGFEDNPNHSMVIRESSSYKDIFNTMRVKFTSKYGQPLSEDNNVSIWRKGHNQIKLGFEFSEEWQPGFPSLGIQATRHLSTQVYILYENDSRNSDY